MDGASTPEGGGAPLEIQPGQRFAVGSDLSLEVVDVRAHGGRRVVDVLLRVGGLAVWLPAAGPPSPNWGEIAAEERPAVLRLPARSPAWSRDAPAQSWLAVVADGPDGAGATRSGTVVLDHRTQGAVVAVVDDEGPSVRPERCPRGVSCSIRP